jgi:hypothetical protein
VKELEKNFVRRIAVFSEKLQELQNKNRNRAPALISETPVFYRRRKIRSQQ